MNEYNLPLDYTIIANNTNFSVWIWIRKKQLRIIILARWPLAINVLWLWVTFNWTYGLTVNTGSELWSERDFSYVAPQVACVSIQFASWKLEFVFMFSKGFLQCQNAGDQTFSNYHTINNNLLVLWVLKAIRACGETLAIIINSNKT